MLFRSKDYQLAENGDNEKKVKGWFYYGVVKVVGKKADETTTTYYMLDRNLGIWTGNDLLLIRQRISFIMRLQH